MSLVRLNPHIPELPHHHHSQRHVLNDQLAGADEYLHYLKDHVSHLHRIAATSDAAHLKPRRPHCPELPSAENYFASRLQRGTCFGNLDEQLGRHYIADTDAVIPWLGITVAKLRRPLTADIPGLEIDHVLIDSPAYHAGMCAGDVLIAVQLCSKTALVPDATVPLRGSTLRNIMNMTHPGDVLRFDGVRAEFPRPTMVRSSGSVGFAELCFTVEVDCVATKQDIEEDMERVRNARTRDAHRRTQGIRGIRYCPRHSVPGPYCAPSLRICSYCKVRVLSQCSFDSSLCPSLCYHWVGPTLQSQFMTPSRVSEGKRFVICGSCASARRVCPYCLTKVR